MFLQRSMLGVTAAGLVSLPYLLSSPASDPAADTQPRPDDPSAVLTAWLDQTNQPEPPASQRPQTAQPVSMEDVFRFEITPDWVLSRWPRVLTATNQPELKGYRVTLLTGTGHRDLAGSLTYHFNAEQKLQRIVFHGTTGDASPLVDLMIERFTFRERPGDAGMQRYQVEWSGKVVSELRVRPAAVVDAGQPRRRFLVNLLIERPGWLGWFHGGRNGPAQIDVRL